MGGVNGIRAAFADRVVGDGGKLRAGLAVDASEYDVIGSTAQPWAPLF
jgi:hypothetical protein